MSEDEIQTLIENGVSELYRGFYRLEQAGDWQSAYDQMGTIMNMLMEDREDIRHKYAIIA